jgi:hypothetical protein
MLRVISGAFEARATTDKKSFFCVLVVCIVHKNVPGAIV